MLSPAKLGFSAIAILCVVVVATLPGTLQPAALTASAALFVGTVAAYLQRQILEFNRWVNRPSLVVTKLKLESSRNEIEIVNLDSKVASRVYIGSFLFSNDGSKAMPLYDEVQPTLVKDYPICQGDVLKHPFRGDQQSQEEDKKRYGGPLEERIDAFLANNSSNVFLVIAIRDRLIQKDEDTPLFFFRNSGSGKSFDFRSEHFGKHRDIFQRVSKFVSARYNEA